MPTAKIFEMFLDFRSFAKIESLVSFTSIEPIWLWDYAELNISMQNQNYSTLESKNSSLANFVKNG